MERILAMLLAYMWQNAREGRVVTEYFFYDDDIDTLTGKQKISVKIEIGAKDETAPNPPEA
jgi:hypothetical protein